MSSRTLVRRPFAPRNAMQPTVDRIFNEAFWHDPFRTLWASTGTGNGYGAGYWPLPLDVYATQDDVVVIAAVPGLGPDDIQVTYNQGVVTFAGQLVNAAGSQEGKAATWYLHELPHGTFQRSVTLPFEVDADAAEATFEHGVLHLRLPKAERARPKQIQVRLVENGAAAEVPEAISDGNA